MRKFVSLLVIRNGKSVKEFGATDLELGGLVSLSDGDLLGVRSSGLLEEVSDIGN